MTSASRPDGTGGRDAPLNAGFDDAPDAYDELRATGHMSRRRLDIFTELLAGSRGTVVELGSGTGTLLRALAARLPDRQFVGVEPLDNYVAFAREQAEARGLHNVRFEAAPAEALTSVVPPASAGTVLSVDALHHVADLDRVVAEVGAATTPGAHWYAMEPNRMHPYVWAYHSFTDGERTFDHRDFQRRAAGAGWRPVDRRTWFLYPSGVRAVPPWAATLERRLERIPAVAGARLLELIRDDRA